MSPEMAGVAGLVLLLVLLFSGMYIGGAMAMVGFLGYVAVMGSKPACVMIAQIPFSTVSSYAMTTIPLFILMGIIILKSGVGSSLYETAYCWIGQFKGGLAMATILACAFFAAITGSSTPAVITMGQVAVPEMRKRNYDDRLTSGSIASAGTLAFLIPPSMAFILYGILTEQSIGLLFIAGIVPGIFLCFLFMLTILIVTILNPNAGPAGDKTSLKTKLYSLKGVWHTLLLFIIVLGGIYAGIFTPTEAGAIGAFGAIVITILCRRLKVKDLFHGLLESVLTTAMVFLLIIGAFLFTKFLAVSRLPILLSTMIAGLPLPPMVIFFCIIIFYIFLGMFLDIFSAVLITIPVLYSLITAMGFDPIWFGVMIVIVMQMGLVTPPVGMDVYVLAGTVDIPLQTIFRGVMPFLAAMILCIFILALFPQIALWLPKTM